MGQKKGTVPAHIQPKMFSHPGVNTPCIIVLSQITDPRERSCNTRYSIVTILFIVFIAVLCGAKNWEEIYHVLEGLSDWLQLYVDISCGIPSRWTLERVVSLIPTAQLQPLFLQFATRLQQGGTVAIEEQFSGIDGAQLETLEKNGGRVENRKYTLLRAEGLSGIDEWLNCCCIGKIERIRSEGEKESKQICYYITSLDFDINQFGKSA